MYQAAAVSAVRGHLPHVTAFSGQGKRGVTRRGPVKTDVVFSMGNERAVHLAFAREIKPRPLEYVKECPDAHAVVSSQRIVRSSGPGPRFAIIPGRSWSVASLTDVMVLKESLRGVPFFLKTALGQNASEFCAVANCTTWPLSAFLFGSVGSARRRPPKQLPRPSVGPPPPPNPSPTSRARIAGALLLPQSDALVRAASARYEATL